MRILIVGAGAVGGYFGGRLLEKGEDVTFLVREKRKGLLQANGLKLNSVHGNVDLKPKVLTVKDTSEAFDVVIVSTKAYHLSDVVDSIEPFVAKNTMILPLLNGVSHVEVLQNRFGKENVIGGLCFIESTLDVTGQVVQTSPIHDLVFGELSGERTERIEKLEKAFSGTKANFRLSDEIVREMWHKYLFITTLSGVTTLMRAPIGPIRESIGGQETIERLVKELSTVMRAIQAPIAETIEQIMLERVQAMGYDMKSSMQRDMEKGQAVEADHLQGYIYNIAQTEKLNVPVLQVIYSNLKVYEQSLEG
ncbi:ketopantoate reductase family protein [Cytobacillus sp. S13-E01]|uniref:ketopantoate reductase family protein n=1 Tax=Cytobacillus sp. S13-E01 TaxID=3031326 RepID=UPI0023D893D1|nr:ketopantoate reductase family protein [Cytobacillus sp. S13-E01]MDF0726356.1 ketopantoate reductase family protein [Cytobacillus sp. S13-E01]